MKNSKIFSVTLLSTGIMFSLLGGIRPAHAACPGFDCALSGSSANPGWGVVNTGGNGVNGEGVDVGVFGHSTSTIRGSGVSGLADGDSSMGFVSAGVLGSATSTTGVTRGVEGRVSSVSGRGVSGLALSTTGSTFGVFGSATSNTGTGVRGEASTTSSSAVGVVGEAYNGVIGNTVDGTGVSGVASGTGSNIGVFGSTSSSAGGAWAGFFVGNTYTIGDIDASGAKLFRIDHPLDPANKYLQHASIESSEVLNQYSGNALLDNNGEAWVALPSWFEAVNKDIRYQLTAIGAPGPNLYIAEKMSQHRFKVAGGKPGSEVSWQITGVRNDPYMQHHPLVVEKPKTAVERGFYAFPQGYGQPESKALPAIYRSPTMPGRPK
jgi:hypothetical protein